jgi:mannose-6-phosphate isomerase-like protein (cupin superfamily)
VTASADRRFAVGRAEVTVKVDRSTTGDALALVEWTIPEGAPGPPVHVHHAASETFYVLDGRVTFTHAERSVEAGAGETLHVQPGVPHTMVNTGPTTARVLELYAPGALLALIEEVGSLLGQGVSPRDPAILDAYRRHQSQVVPTPGA